MTKPNPREGIVTIELDGVKVELHPTHVAMTNINKLCENLGNAHKEVSKINTEYMGYVLAFGAGGKWPNMSSDEISEILFRNGVMNLHISMMKYIEKLGYGGKEKRPTKEDAEENGNPN